MWAGVICMGVLGDFIILEEALFCVGDVVFLCVVRFYINPGNK